MKITMELSAEEVKKLQDIAGFLIRDNEEANDAIRVAFEKANQIKVKDSQDFKNAIVEMVKYMAFYTKNVCVPSEPIEVEWGMKGTRDHEDIKSILPVITLVNKTEY